MKTTSSLLISAAAALTAAQSTSPAPDVPSISSGIPSVSTTSSSSPPTLTSAPTLIHPNDAQSSTLDSILTDVILSYSTELLSILSAFEDLPASAINEIAAGPSFSPSPENWGAWAADPTPTQIPWETVLPADLHSQYDALRSDVATDLFSAVQTPLNSIYASEYGPNASPPWPTKGPIMVPAVPAAEGAGADLRPAAVAAVAAAVGFAAFFM